MKKEGKTITKILRMTPSEHDKILTKISELGGITFTKYAMSSMLPPPPLTLVSSHLSSLFLRKL